MTFSLTLNNYHSEKTNSPNINTIKIKITCWLRKMQNNKYIVLKDIGFMCFILVNNQFLTMKITKYTK